MRPTVLVSGAGIAGLSVAYWLDRYGYDVTVVERAAAPRHAGYKIDVRGAALEVLDAMGLLEAARAQATAIDRVSHVDARGRVVATVDADFFGGRVAGDLEILRGDLSRLLLAAVAGRVVVRFGDEIARLAPDPAGVDVAFASSPPERFDIVIGADGLRSAVRALAFGPDDAFVRSLDHHVAAFDVPNDLGLDAEEVVYAEAGRTVNVYRTTRRDALTVLLMFASARLGPDGGARRDRPDRAGQHDLLAAAFDGAGWEVARLLRAGRRAPELYFDALSQVHLDGWSRGRIGLVGDAAYAPSPASGKGTSVALVGAYVLAGELASTRDPGQGFAAYEAELRAFVARNQALAASNLRGMVLPTRRAVWIQTRLLGLLPRVPGGRRLVERVVRAIHDAATAIALKPYESAGRRAEPAGPGVGASAAAEPATPSVAALRSR